MSDEVEMMQQLMDEAKRLGLAKGFNPEWIDQYQFLEDIRLHGHKLPVVLRMLKEEYADFEYEEGYGAASVLASYVLQNARMVQEGVVIRRGV